MSKRSRLLRDRLTRLHRLRKTALAPLSTRQNEHRASEHRANESRASAQKPLPPPRRRRVSAWLLTPLVLIALLFCAFRLVVLPRVAFDLERTVRAQIIPQLQDRIGARVEIGRIESDYVSGVTLHDVVIGRGAKTPFGALMRAPKVQLELDLVSLAFNRTDATRALHRVLVQSPQLYIERDARGALNWTRLWKPQAQGASSRTSALFQVSNARVYLRDASLRSRDGKPLLARFDKVNLSAQTNGDNATSFDARAPLALIGAKSFDSAAGGALYTAKDISTSGQIAADASWITGKTRVPSVPAALPIEYSKGVNVGVLGQPAAASGKLAARFNFAWTKPRRNADLLQNLMLTGVLRAQNVGLTFAKNWPNTSQRAVVRNLNGLVEIDGRALQTRSISLDVLNTPIVFNGAMTLRPDALPVAALDVEARSSRLDVARLWSVFAPSLRAQNTDLRGFALRGGIANGSVRIKGNAANPQINGEIAEIGRASCRERVCSTV